MDSIGSGNARRVEDLDLIEVGLGRGLATKRHRLTRLANKGRIGVAVSEYGDGRDPHLVGGTDNTASNFASVGDE